MPSFKVFETCQPLWALPRSKIGNCDSEILISKCLTQTRPFIAVDFFTMIIRHSPLIFFLMTMRQCDWLVMSRSGDRPWSRVERASIFTVCHWSSLKISTSPRSGSRSRVMRRSLRCQDGDLDSSTILETCDTADGEGRWC